MYSAVTILSDFIMLMKNFFQTHVSTIFQRKEKKSQLENTKQKLYYISVCSFALQFRKTVELTLIYIHVYLFSEFT